MRYLLALALLLSLSSSVAAQTISGPKPTTVGTAAPGQIPGTTTNDSACAGCVGEYASGLDPGTTHTVTISQAAPGIITWSGNTLTIGSAVNFTTSSGLPTGLTVGTNYYVCNASFVSGTSFAVATSAALAWAGTCVTTSSAGSGTQTAVANAILTSNTDFSIASVNLTAGDWDVSGQCAFTSNAATTISRFSASINTVDAVLGAIGKKQVLVYDSSAAIPISDADSYLQTPTVQILVSTTTPTYLVCDGVFATNVQSGFGFIRARRVR